MIESDEIEAVDPRSPRPATGFVRLTKSAVADAVIGPGVGAIGSAGAVQAVGGRVGQRLAVGGGDGIGDAGDVEIIGAGQRGRAHVGGAIVDAHNIGLVVEGVGLIEIDGAVLQLSLS